MDNPNSVRDNPRLSVMPVAASQSSHAPRWSHFTGLYHDEFANDSFWIRETGTLVLPAYADVRRVTLHGEFRPWPEAAEKVGACPSLDVKLGDEVLTTLRPAEAGPFAYSFDLPAVESGQTLRVELTLGGVSWSNLRAWLGRKTAKWPLPGFVSNGWQLARKQNKNRQLRVRRLETDTGEIIFDFSDRHSPYHRAFARRHRKLGLNVVGFHKADLGVGESARCMVRAADAAQLAVAVVPLKLHCLSPQTDASLAARFDEHGKYEVNVMHLDAPQSRDVDHHHGPSLRAGRYNVGYWAWELPEFPDAWVEYAQFFDEIWCPSEFVRASIAPKLRQSVHAMPHAIGFERPTAAQAALREKFKLPTDRLLFLFSYDLHSYNERKNPRAVLEAYRRAFPTARDVGVVVKVHNHTSHPAEFAALRETVAAIPGATLLAATLPRHEVYELQAACDVFVSLHRSEGYGLSVAESMFLGKPAISTNWSGTSEFVDETNGAPVRFSLVQLEKNVGPYAKGQTWAEPDIDHAAWWMRRLADDAVLRGRLGAAARATIEQRFAPAVIGARYRRRLEAIAGFL